MSNILQVSPELMAFIRTLPEGLKADIYRGGVVDVVISPMLPFESCYEACDVATRQLCKISSGEWVHAILVPLPKVDPAGYDLKGNIFKRKSYNP